MHLGFSAWEWDSMAWYLQRVYLEGLEAEGLLTREDAVPGTGTNDDQRIASVLGHGGRKVEVASEVIDLAAMRRELSGVTDGV